MPLADTRRAAALLAASLVATMVISNVAAAPSDIAAASPAAGVAPTALPIPTGARRPIRNTVNKACNAQCLFPIYLVAQAQLLEIDNVSCVNTVANDNNFKYFAIMNGFNVNNIVGLIPATQLIVDGGLTTVVANAGGPFFFGPGEGVYMLTGGSGFTVTCTVSGYVSAAQ